MNNQARQKRAAKGARSTPESADVAPSASENRGALERRRTKAGAIRWYVRLRMPDGSRPRFPLGENMTEARARSKADAVAERVREKGLQPPPARRGRPVEGAAPAGRGDTVRELGEAWTSGDLLRRFGPVNGLKVKRSARLDRYRLDAYVNKRLGDKRVADVTDADVERVMRELPAKSSAATRLRMHSLLHRFFDLAIMPARLRPEGSNPVSRYLRPSKGAAKLFAYLYPTEVLSLLACAAIPLGRRVLYALAAYTGLRKSSLFALVWENVDLSHGTIVSLVSKNELPQLFEIPAGLVALLVRWREACGKPDRGPVVADVGPSPKGLASTLRGDLRTAGVMRDLLFSNAANVEPLRFHDLRATFVTWSKRAGKDDYWITSRTGHVTDAMIERYTRAARVLAELEIDAFPPIGQAIPELAQGGGFGHVSDASRRKKRKGRAK